MESVVLNGKVRPTKSFWEDNEDLLASKCIRDLYESDTTTNKSFSSTVMWAIYYIYDFRSRYFRAPLLERIKLIEVDYIGEEGFIEKNKEVLKPIIELYKYLQKDSELRYLDTWQEIVEARRLYIEDLMGKATESFNPKIWKVIDEMLLNSEKIMAQKDGIMKRISEAGEGKIKGSQKLSLLAQGDILLKEAKK